MRRSFAGPGLIAASVAVTAWGCILFVNDDSSNLGATCTFQGQDTACGKCVLSACSAPLDKCCVDSNCSSSLSSLDDCAGNGNGVSCSELLAYPTTTLGDCIQSACPACVMNTTGDGGGTTGATSCSKEGDSCFCTVGTEGNPANGMECDGSTVPSGLCCADYGWPKATATTCTCQPFSCTPESYGGYCSLTTNSTGTTSWSGSVCCVVGANCICDSSFDSCPSSEPEVSTCTVGAITCSSSQVQVSSCSF